MSGLLFGVGAVAVVVGVVMIGFGIPVTEFSFGNTLIGAGTTAAVGGLIIIGLSAVVTQLHRLNEAMAMWTPTRPGQRLDVFENAAGARAAPPAGRIPFPAKPKTADVEMREPQPFEPRMAAAAPAELPVVEDQPAQHAAPTLRNPDEPPVTVEDEVSLSPQQPMVAPERAAAGLAENRYEPTRDAGWRSPLPPAAPEQMRPPHTAYFDAMWPAESKPAKSSAGTEAKPYYEQKLDLPPPEAAAAPTTPAEPEAPMLPPENEPRAVAILKSGVVDGMGYTLYVDGSIEAELPQGILRFASINELRSHLENNS